MGDGKHLLGSKLRADVVGTGIKSLWGFPKLGAPCWGPYSDKRSLPFGGLLGVPYVRTPPHILSDVMKKV